MTRVPLVAMVLTLLITSPIPGRGEPQTPNPEARSVRVGFLRPGGGYTVETLTMDAYVARVLAGEAARDSQPAALEALAIAVRTFAAANRTRHRADGFDLCDQTHCQVLRAATAATERAARATEGRLLLRGGVPASIYYTASCGGRTELPSAVWPGAEDPPFLPVKDDDACEGAPAWTAVLHESDLLRALRAAGFRGNRIDDLRIASRTSSGRVARLAIDGLDPSSISGQELRVAVGRTIGWQHIKSTAFDLRRRDGAYTFSGHGSGHGVGLCVIGSAHLAQRGMSADQILARYFPGLQIAGMTAARETPPPAPMRTSTVTATLPDDDEGLRVSIEKQALAARGELSRALGVAPPRVTLRFHATIDEYQRATGAPWYTGSAVIREELHLIPVVGLRSRGMLEQAIRRGLVHLMVDGPLSERPAWVRDGAALYYSSAHDTEVAGRIACPSDAELQAPVSIGALSTAYARARACFAKQIAGGRSWREVR